MRRTKGFTIYPPESLKSRLRLIAEERGRSVNKQIIKFLERSVERAERREPQGTLARA